MRLSESHEVDESPFAIFIHTLNLVNVKATTPL
jgi:hypothetical protein